MKTLTLTLVSILLIVSSHAQSSYGLYAGVQYCISHQQIIRDNPSLVIKDNEPNIGYLAGFQYAFSFNSNWAFINQTGYSQVNLLTPLENHSVSAHYLKSVFLLGVKPLANRKSPWNNTALETGLGIAYFLMGSEFLSAHHEMSNIEFSYDLGLRIPIKNISIKPFLNNSLTSYKRFEQPEIKINYSFRTYGILLSYKFNK